MTHDSGNATWEDDEDGGTPITADALENIEDELDDAVTSDDIAAIVVCTQTEYDALTPDSDTLYLVTS